MVILINSEKKKHYYKIQHPFPDTLSKGGIKGNLSNVKFIYTGSMLRCQFSPNRPLCMQMLSHFSRVQLCDPVDYSPPGFSVHGISQAKRLEQVSISSSRGKFQPGIKPTSPALAGRVFRTEFPGNSKLTYRCNAIMTEIPTEYL